MTNWSICSTFSTNLNNNGLATIADVNIFLKLFFTVVLFVVFSVIPAGNAYAQAEKPDSLKTSHSAVAATLLSTFIPGAGQVYNHKYWKVPIIYAGAATMIYFVGYNQKYYLEFKQAYSYRIDNDTTTIDAYPWATKESLQHQKDRWRRYRDMNLIGLGILYMLNIIDANVDAHFFNYEINDDLSIRVEPLLICKEKLLTLQNPAPLGITVRFTF